MFDALPVEVRPKINQHHAYYRELLCQERASKAKGRNAAERNSSQRSQNTSQPLFQIIHMTLDHTRSLKKTHPKMMKIQMKMTLSRKPSTNSWQEPEELIFARQTRSLQSLEEQSMHILSATTIMNV